MGLEQGYTVFERPRGRGELAVEFRVAGNFENTDVSFDDIQSMPPGYWPRDSKRLVARDATGERLVTRFETHGRRVRIVVDDRNATYPVVIEPRVAPAELFAFPIVQWFDLDTQRSSDRSRRDDSTDEQSIFLSTWFALLAGIVGLAVLLSQFQLNRQ